MLTVDAMVTVDPVDRESLGARSLLIALFLPLVLVGPVPFAADSGSTQHILTIFSFSDLRVNGGELAACILAGEKPENIPVIHDSGYREPTVWEGYKKFILGAVALVLLQALMIIALLLQRARRRKSEVDYRHSEERFRAIADAVPALVWMSDADGKYIYMNKKWSDFTGTEPGVNLRDVWSSFVHPDDLRTFVDAVSATQRRERYTNEYRLKRQDGAYRWILDTAVLRFDDNGSFAGFIGSAIDITDQKTTQHALNKVSGQLIEAQEKERSRIARELHDDICQRLFLLSIDLGHAVQTARAAPSQAERRGSEVTRLCRMKEASQLCSDIGRAVQALSRELHSSSLDYLGIVAAVSGLCKEFSERNQLSVEFTSAGVAKFLPRDVSLCLFRVTQEALRNAEKYSGVSHIEVALQGWLDVVELEVRDAGVGFDPAEAKNRGGLGLVSMQERVNLVGGTISIESHPNGGTKVKATIPLGSQEGAITA
jgi:PAS domain S-box-containing protein